MQDTQIEEEIKHTVFDNVRKDRGCAKDRTEECLLQEGLSVMDDLFQPILILFFAGHTV